MTHSNCHLQRLRVVKGGRPVYDQTFHLGVNIIRGENGSGKSTIADFIFYVLGGEFENWKTIAGRCHEVQAEIVTRSGVLTLRREIAKAQTAMQVFFGSFEDADKHGLDGWERFPIRRSESRESISQILFRASGIPEAQSQGASNITMHQILRLLYSDQRTPAALLFKYEPFDMREIREAVGDLICGMSVYELYETELRVRELEKQFDEKDRRFSALLSALPPDQALARTGAIESRLTELEKEYAQLNSEIENVNVHVDRLQVEEFAKQRGKLVDEIRSLKRALSRSEERKNIVDLELADLIKFIEYLEELSEKVTRAQGASDIVGSIEFTHCPACLTPLSDDHGAFHCVLCGAETDPERERSRYLQIKLDLDIQLRELRQLLEERQRTLSVTEKEIRARRRSYEEGLADYAICYDHSASPRDSFIAQRYQRLGQIDRERIELDRMRDRAIEIEALAKEKADLQAVIAQNKDRLKALEAATQRRRAQALTLVSETAKSLLRRDLDRQIEFRRAESVAINFGDNSVLVDGELNFAESSNVIVKNSAILALLLAACQDEQFYHPRFALFDNIEDKGMEQDRSYNFQTLIAEMSMSARFKHQIIFTTSMLNPALNDEKYVVGPNYTHDKRTLNFDTE